MEKKFCPICRKRLFSTASVVPMELNSHTGRWAKEYGQVPPAESQGWFDVGAKCAKNVLKQQEAGR